LIISLPKQETTMCAPDFSAFIYRGGSLLRLADP